MTKAMLSYFLLDSDACFIAAILRFSIQALIVLIKPSRTMIKLAIFSWGIENKKSQNRRPDPSLSRLQASTPHKIEPTLTNSFQLFVILLCLNQYRNIVVRIFPQREEVLVSPARFRRVGLQCGRVCHSEMRKWI